MNEPIPNELKPEPDKIGLGKRIYACLDASASLENVCGLALSTNLKDERVVALLKECKIKAAEARQDADLAMHELGIGYHQIYKNHLGVIECEQGEGL